MDALIIEFALQIIELLKEPIDPNIYIILDRITSNCG